MDDLISDEERRRRHKAWLESWGLTAEDWRRIRQLAADTNPHFTPAALDDLSVPVRVGAAMADRRRHLSGELLGVIDGRAILAWPMDERERGAWARRTKLR